MAKLRNGPGKVTLPLVCPLRRLTDSVDDTGRRATARAADAEAETHV